jgi:hypothetical protein
MDRWIDYVLANGMTVMNEEIEMKWKETVVV